MVKKQKKKTPITQISTAKAKFKRSHAETARLIRRFHVLNKELAKCRASPQTLKNREAEILKEMESLGGLDWYQKASQLGQSKARGGDSSKWLIQTLKSHCKEALDKTTKPLKVLDVGAVAPNNYEAYSSWITAIPIDLNPQHPNIQKQDFLRMQPPALADRFDIVCLSLVINFVGDPKDRGKNFFMPITTTDRLHYLFLVVPLPCVTNSRYMTHEHLLEMMASIGYTNCIHHHFSNKLAYYLFELVCKPNTKNITWKKKIIPGKEGGARNNFCIVMQ
ncbi:uncharacterized protein RHIMIDRAFT_199806 [Rhizopus microsporus ATCC 52813]|uniref:25S rRNA adenine-N(1) methyltransferase n=1 Tax=Rhizopus microsporus ATCC 52813 TaxID=1340429 RepID=A0A2G4T0J4_RHIZD|nr:uncharacterized protein RHIMIDRAFT_199806 [Rhizopus microsporus ATCC 52813]PHZ14521.1 hypothetical protein RHIMIDRAFT_199806 [Rhizopus microsporus ATCC 52813]